MKEQIFGREFWKTSYTAASTYQTSYLSIKDGKLISVKVAGKDHDKNESIKEILNTLKFNEPFGFQTIHGQGRTAFVAGILLRFRLQCRWKNPRGNRWIPGVFHQPQRLGHPREARVLTIALATENGWEYQRLREPLAWGTRLTTPTWTIAALSRSKALQHPRPARFPVHHLRLLGSINRTIQPLFSRPPVRSWAFTPKANS